nr:immunoglobulin heavy chain junction region [Macaca mulatta]MOX91930.1 immunoglobulin heavy chain junction region [Macaca mulatta]MOX92465.1 immunoglobulin heavy chain junction region [Macaca mulatta]MOX92920.1 immunoglobulin heavy chain junction region [Macaca mulatta]MOX94486.1 immunoglobulin heavy chain junction region [Macaca mulatta]
CTRDLYYFDSGYYLYALDSW